MAKIFYVKENTPDYAQCHFFKTEKEALEYGISQLPQFDMFGEPANDEEADGEEWYTGASLTFKKGILFSQEQGSVYVQAMDEDAAREYVVEDAGEYGAAMFFDGFKKGMYGYLGNGVDGRGFKWDWDGDDINENINIGGMGPVVLPMDGGVGSGDVPAGKGDAEEEYKKERMKHLKSFESFINKFNENAEVSLNEDRERQLVEFRDFLAELNDNKLAIEKSIGGLNDRKAEILSKQIMDLFNTLYKLYK